MKGLLVVPWHTARDETLSINTPAATNGHPLKLLFRSIVTLLGE
jgi:hypothetical protein